MRRDSIAVLSIAVLLVVCLYVVCSSSSGVEIQLEDWMKTTGTHKGLYTQAEKDAIGLAVVCDLLSRHSNAGKKQPCFVRFEGKDPPEDVLTTLTKIYPRVRAASQAEWREATGRDRVGSYRGLMFSVGRINAVSRTEVTVMGDWDGGPFGRAYYDYTVRFIDGQWQPVVASVRRC